MVVEATLFDEEGDVFADWRMQEADLMYASGCGQRSGK